MPVPPNAPPAPPKPPAPAGGPPGAPPAAPPKPPAAAPPAAPPKPPTGAADPATALGAVNSRVAGLLAAAAKGQLPEGFAEEAKAIAAILTGLADGTTGAPAAAPTGAPAPAAPAAPPAPPAGHAPPPPPPQMKRDAAEVEKLEAQLLSKKLAAEVETKVTLDYVSSQAWRISDLVATGKLDDAKALIGKLSDVIASVETGKAAGGGEEKTMGTEKAATVKAETTFEQFHTWSIAQLAKASTEEPEAALARLTHLAKVAKNFEQKGAGDKGAIDVEYETAFVGDGLPGKASDLTTKSDQDVDDGKIENQDTTGDKASSDVPFAKAIADAVDAIEKKVATAKSDSGLPKGAETAADGFVWPMDMSVDEADAKAAAERIEKAETPRASEDDWGRDPWSV